MRTKSDKLFRVINNIYYLSCLFTIFAVSTMPIPLIDKGIHTFAWIYLLMVYAYFFDDRPPKLLNVRDMLDLTDKENEFLEKLLNVSHVSLSLMRKIQLHEDWRVVNQSISELDEYYRELRRLSPPPKYRQRHEEILRDIDGFLEGLKESDFYLVSKYGQTVVNPKY